MLLPSDLLTILWVVPRFLGELDSVNAMISAKAESLQYKRNYECSRLKNSCRNEIAAAAVVVGAAPVRLGAEPVLCEAVLLSNCWRIQSTGRLRNHLPLR